MSDGNGLASGVGWWFAVLELLGVWLGAIGTASAAFVALWLASRRLRPELHCRPSIEDEEPRLRGNWRVNLSNRSPIAVRIVDCDLRWWAPTLRRPFAKGEMLAHVAGRAIGERISVDDLFTDLPFTLAAYEHARLWVIVPRRGPYVRGPAWRRWLACHTLRLVLQNATGERFVVKPPPSWKASVLAEARGN